MALVLTSVEAFGKEIDEGLTKRFQQTLVLQGTGAATDLTYDWANFTGTFWTAVSGSEPGATALQTIKNIALKAYQLLSVSGEALLLKESVATGATLATGQYKYSAITAHVPSLAFFTAEGPTAWTFEIYWDLQNNQSPVKVQRP